MSRPFLLLIVTFANPDSILERFVDLVLEEPVAVVAREGRLELRVEEE